MSRMDILTDDEIAALNANSKLVKKYIEEIDRESAYEMLTKKIEDAAAQQQTEEKASRSTKSQPSMGTEIGKSVVKVVTSATFIRGVFGVLSKMFKK